MRYPWYRMFRAPNLWLSGIGMIIALTDLALMLGWGISPQIFSLDLMWFSLGFTVASLPFTAIQIFRAGRPAPPHLFPEPLEFSQAQDKARVLLDSFLTEGQRLDLERHGFFVHWGKNHIYHIKRGWSMNITAFSRGVLQPELICAYPYSDGGIVMPPEDVMLAQLLWLRNDEKGFRRKANILR